MLEEFGPNAIPLHFTSNHDENSWNGTEFERMGQATWQMAALTFALPGIPLIYTGQEVGNTKQLEFFEKTICNRMRLLCLPTSIRSSSGSSTNHRLCRCLRTAGQLWK